MRFLLRPLALIAIAAVGACAAPTLPTPPPSETSVALVDGEAIVTGKAEENGLVACLNQDTDRGVIEMADANGDFEIRIAAEEGHHLTLWQVAGGASGQLLEIVVPAETP